MISKTPATCPWCASEVEQEGYTCDSICYHSWIAWALRLSRVEPRTIAIVNDDEPPLSLELQPWYEEEIWK